MDYNMVCFFNFDLKKGEEIYFDEDETTYTLVGDIELLPEYNNFEGVFATYPIQNILNYMNIDKYSVDYVARQLRVDVPRSMLRCNGEYVENVEDNKIKSEGEKNEEEEGSHKEEDCKTEPVELREDRQACSPLIQLFYGFASE